MSDSPSFPRAAATKDEAPVIRDTLMEQIVEDSADLSMDHGFRAWLQVLGS